MIHLKKSLAALIAVLATVGCTSPQDGKTTTDAPEKMYCELISPQTVQPLGINDDIKDFGGPVVKKPSRTIKCALYDAEEGEDRLSVYGYEVAAENLPKELSEAQAAMAKYAREDPKHYVVLEETQNFGYAWFTGEVAAANLVTDSRHISVTIPASESQAETFTPIALAVAQEVDRNLPAWDQANPEK